VSLVAGATITAQVLADLKRLHEQERQIILGANVIDDGIGLVILAAVAGLTESQRVIAWGLTKTTLIAVGFLGGTLLVGRFIVPSVRLIQEPAGSKDVEDMVTEP